MPYDPNKPQNGTVVDADFLRAQFNALKTLLDAQQAQINALEAQNESLTQQLASKPNAQEVADIIAANAARNVDALAQLPPPWSMNPPDRDEFNETRDKVNELVSGLRHPA